MIAVYINNNQFRVEEDHVEEFKTGRRIKANCGDDGYVYSTILSSSYSDPYTTIIITESLLTSNLIDVLYGIVNIGDTGSLPNHLHDGLEGQGGILSYITTDILNTYSGTLQTQINSKPDTFLELQDTPSIYDSGKYAVSTTSGIIWGTAGSSNVQTFLDLTDTPTTYSGTADLFAKSTGSGIIWSTIPDIDINTFISLIDVPNTYSGTSGKFAQSTGSGIMWATVPDLGIQTFLGLTDTPDIYSEGMFAQSTSSGIIWSTISGSGSSDVQTFLDLIDTPLTYTGHDGEFVKVVGNTLEFSTISGISGTSDSSALFELDEYGGLMPVATISGINDVILVAPDNSRWRLIVSNIGVLSTEAF